MMSSAIDGMILVRSAATMPTDARAARRGDMRKISVSLRGHRTSISLEPEFWDSFRSLCRNDGRRPSAVLAEIDATRRENLSSAVRLWVLARLWRGMR